ncbi:hypothetical protein [Rhizobium sp. BK176]|uniref:hypothetical protein n=1 Tax=Rhizobium sp. BK176 TaxID=2587071 RepID=UPI002167DDFD|nr:hypothetical protein [Rhizobium sp. BK176]MCS4090007.1 hypothetical protein [Rhizobium sp. BK176]
MRHKDIEFIRLSVSGGETFDVRSFADAFRRLGLSGGRWVRASDGGDRVVIEERSWRGTWSRRRAAVFHVDGVLHVSAKIVLALYRETVAADKKVMAWEADGFRCRPVPVKKWSLRGEFGSARIGCERRANAGLRHDEELEEHGLRARPCRRLFSEYRFERPRPKDVNWKRFRNTRWKEKAF